MKRPEGDDLRAQLLLCAVRSGSSDEALATLGRQGVSLSPTQLDIVENLLSDSGTVAGHGLVQMFREAHGRLGPEWMEFALLGKIFQAVSRSDPAELTLLESMVGEFNETRSYCWIILRAVQSEACRRNGDLALAQFHVRDGFERLPRVLHPAIAGICQAHIEHSRIVAQDSGNFSLALESLSSAEENAKKLGLRFAPLVAYQLASLHWSSGQFSAALNMHLDSAHREQLLVAYGPAWLIRSHLSAAKCAIDANELLIAEKELRTADQLLRETENVPRMLPGFFLLYSGELNLKALKGKDSRGFELLEEACQHFESMDPPLHAGLLDAKISITQYAISSDDHRRMFGVLHSILEEATAKGCLEARARALVFESSLFVSDNPPLRAAFDDLVTRLHVINNPALLMQAFANLFTYSLRYLEQPDQAFLMGRLSNLQTVLDESCFQDLYETYIEKRYSWAIENRLAEELEKEDQAFDDESTGGREPTI